MDKLRYHKDPAGRLPWANPARPFRRSGQGRGSHGFTLLEILITIFIFAIIATTIFGSYNAVFSSAADIKTDMMASEMAKNCLNRMMLDFQSLYVSLPPAYAQPQGDQEPDPYRMVGEVTTSGDKPFARLRFASLAHLPLGAAKREGIAEIIYYVRSTQDGGYTLRRSDNLLVYGMVEEKETDPILCENLQALAFKYYGPAGEEQDTWDSESEDSGYATPRAIGIKLAIGRDERTQEFEALVKLLQFREKTEK